MCLITKPLIYSNAEVRRYGTDYFHWKKTANLFKAHWSSLGPYIQFAQANFQTRTFIAYQVRVDIEFKVQIKSIAKHIFMYIYRWNLVEGFIDIASKILRLIWVAVGTLLNLERDFIRVRTTQWWSRPLVTSYGTDSFGFDHLANIDTSLIKFSLAFRNLIDEIIGCWWESLANYSLRVFRHRRWNCFYNRSQGISDAEKP